jgi:hypothetical protein
VVSALTCTAIPRLNSTACGNLVVLYIPNWLLK